MRRTSLESLVAGGALVAAVTTVVAFAGSLLGLWSSPHPLVGAVGTAGGVLAAWMAHRPAESLPFRLGALAAGTAALAVEVVMTTGGVGTVQTVAALTTVVVVAAGPFLLMPLTRPVPDWLILVGVFAVTFALAKIVVDSGPLGHDEAAYAVKARAWLVGTPDTGWSIHRGIGQSVLAAAILPFSHSAEALRFLAALLSLGTVAAVWALGRGIRSNRVGIAAAAVFAVAPSFLRRGTEFLTDVPSTGLLLVVALLLWRWATRKDETAWDLYGAVIVAALAFYVRYQSVLALALLGVATVVVARHRVRAQRGNILKAALAGFALLLPHFVFATAATGVPWGVITYTAGRGGRSYLGQGLIDYARHFPDLLAGQLGAVAILVAVVWFGWSAAGHGQRQAATFLAIPAVGQMLALGLISHGEPRFVFFPVALFAVAAAVAADDLRRRIPAKAYRAIAAGFVVAVAASVSLHGVRFDRNAEARGESLEPLAEAAQTVVEQSEGECGILTGRQPQMTWLSGCYTAPFDLRQVNVRLDESLDRFLILTEGGVREPEGELADAYLSLAEPPAVHIDGSGSTGDVQVWRLSD